MTEATDIAIVGGGLAGLTSACLLSRSGFDVTLIEKKQYPFHRVCGEYVSNEVLGFLERNDLLPDHLDLPNIDTFSLTSVSGRQHTIRLPLGGFGISRHDFDHFLYSKAKQCGVRVLENSSVIDIVRENSGFQTRIDGGKTIGSSLVIGSFGKRSSLDKQLDRSFFKQQSPYLGVKYHLKIDLPKNAISLHNFKNGYCGVSNVGGDVFNLCYLSHRSNLRATGSIERLEKEVLFRNPRIESIYKEAEFLFEKPLVINEISFASKPLVENGIIMCGDSAGMITPLCGNGMAMAIHSATLLSNIITKNYGGKRLDLPSITSAYEKAWKNHFKTRLQIGRTVQRLFGGEFTSELAVSLLKTSLGKKLVRLTHGAPF